MREVVGFLPKNCFRFDGVFGAALDHALAHMQRFLSALICTARAGLFGRLDVCSSGCVRGRREHYCAATLDSHRRIMLLIKGRFEPI
jgi:hypothetical protein